MIRAAATVALGALVVAVGGVLALSPRPRSFYLGDLGGGGAGATRSAGEAAVRTASKFARIRTSVRATVPTQDAEGRVRVPVADVVPAALPADGIPTGWDLREFGGKPDVALVRADGRLALRLRSESSAFALYRDVVVDPSVQRRLSWSWKVTRLPVDADGRDPARNDHAAALYVIFPRWPSPLTTSDALGYVWDSAAPVGTILTIASAPNVRLIVVASGRGTVNTWQRYERDVAADYAAVFAGAPGRVGKLALGIDAAHTRGLAEALIADVFFAR